MSMKSKKLLGVFLGLLFTLSCVSSAYADGVAITAASKLAATFNSTKGIIFIVGGFGLVGLAFYAIFGKFRWKWFAGLAVGMGFLAAAAAIVNYTTGDYMDGMSRVAVVDTFEAAADTGSVAAPGTAGRSITGTPRGTTSSKTGTTTGSSSSSSSSSKNTGFLNGLVAGLSGNYSDGNQNSGWYNAGATTGGAISGFLSGVSAANSDTFGDSKINY